VLVQTIVGAVECCRVAVCLTTDVIIVELFLELVELMWIAVSDEKGSFP
jgi:hypothetical protein